MSSYHLPEIQGKRLIIVTLNFLKPFVPYGFVHLHPGSNVQGSVEYAWKTGASLVGSTCWIRDITSIRCFDSSTFSLIAFLDRREAPHGAFVCRYLQQSSIATITWCCPHRLAGSIVTTTLSNRTANHEHLMIQSNAPS